MLFTPGSSVTPAHSHHHVTLLDGDRNPSESGPVRSSCLDYIRSLWNRNDLKDEPSRFSLKHIAHVIAYVTFLIGFELGTGGIRFNRLERDNMDVIGRYGVLGAVVLYALRFVSILVLPQCIANMLGLIMYDAFRSDVKLRQAPILAPCICIRVVTRGDYPNLVQANVKRNMETCRAVGLENFFIEVVTDKVIHLPQNPRVREIVVPVTYRTKGGSLFKARALQYCLEDEVNTILRPDDWIVHLDEETILTENSVKGILNFCTDGRYHFGQGLITYANGPIVNWITTLADSFRVADDMGKLRFQLQCLHRPIFGWKGSYVVTQMGAERDVSYDHGPDGSVAEDCFFSMVAYQRGYKFNFIEGEMWERSPFSFSDFLQQRKRWLQGIFLVVHSGKIGCLYKLLLGFSLYAWASIPFTTWNFILAFLCPLPGNAILDFLLAYVGAINLYMYIYGVLRSFSHRYRHKKWRLILYTLGAICTIPFNIGIEICAVLWGMLGAKYQFYVVKKDHMLINL